ncbi:MAG: glycoside hydrolase family 97 N-terminal domain-containing protein, partial [Prevotellaceae bacterium]|nr:glycoside hydrolase family 97 N-terminal domain-containing protein [Prevotellaceae bacterium]
MRKFLLFAFACGALTLSAQKTLTANSPDGRLTVNVTVGDRLSYSINHDGQQVLAPSPIALAISEKEIWGQNPRLRNSSKRSVSEVIKSPFYRKDQIEDVYTLLTLNFRPDWSVEFRVYDDGVAYRFVTKCKNPFTIQNETVAYCFDKDYTTVVPYVQVGRDGDYESQFHNSFENFYSTAKISELNKQRFMFLPLVVEL